MLIGNFINILDNPCQDPLAACSYKKERRKKENCNLAWHHFITSRFAISTSSSLLLLEDNLMKSVVQRAAWLRL